MPLITDPGDFTNGTTADAVAVNNRLHALFNAINGGLDQVNLTPQAKLLAFPTISHPARTLGTAYQPSTTRPTLVVAVPSMSFTAANQYVNIQMLCDAANPPTTQVDAVTIGNPASGGNSPVWGKLIALVPPGYYYKLTDPSNAGGESLAVTEYAL